jgi:hypothetical protein
LARYGNTKPAPAKSAVSKLPRSPDPRTLRSRTKEFV